MGSATVQAQELANQANIALMAERNKHEYSLAEHTNWWNQEQLAQQNQWNIDQWNRENEYNSPTEQMKRYLEAGVNPLWAMGSDPGNAQHLESGTPQPGVMPSVEAAHVVPEYDPYRAQHIGNIVAAARDVVNGIQGFQQIALQGEDVQTRRAAQVTRSELDEAQATETRASTVGKELSNMWAEGTLDIRIHQESQKLSNMEAQLRNLDAGTKEHDAKVLQIEEQKKFLSQQINESIASIRQRDRALSIQSFEAQTGRMVAGTQQYEAEISRKRYALEDAKFSAQIQQWNNENLLNFMSRFGRTVTGEMKGQVGLEGLGVSGKAGVKELTPADVKRVQECGIVVLQRAADNPTPDNLKDAEEASRLIDAVNVTDRQQRSQKIVDGIFNSSSSSILNPSDEW